VRTLRFALLLLLALPFASRTSRAAEDHPPTRSTRPARLLQSDSIAYAARVQNGNKIGMTETNYGFTGTNFSSFAPSFEYPLGSGHMHMVRGGPWIGAISVDQNGVFEGVSIATEDGSAGSSAAGSGEFTPATTYVGARSTLPNSRFYDPTSISELDFISSYSDEPGNPLLKSRPLDVLVNQYTFEWSFSDYANFIIFHYVVHNDGPPLRNVWFGLYDELASGNMKLQSTYPPVGWFSKKYITWVDSLDMVTERYCGSAVLSACNFSLVPEIVGLSLLGCKPGNFRDTSDKKITFQAWTYSPGNPSRDVDSLKYELMSSGLKTSLNPLPDSLAPGTGDPVELLAVGPFSALDPGDSLSVDFAYIGGLSYDDLSKRAIIAKHAYDLDYIVPVPPPSPKMKAVPRGNSIDLYWENSPENFVDPTSPIGKDFEGYRLYVGDERDSLHLIAQYDLATPPHDTTGFNTGLGPVTLPAPVTIDGDTYQYKFTIANLRDGFKYYTAITSYDLGTTEIESLESGVAQNEALVVPGPAPSQVTGGITVFPNPYRVEAAWDRGQQARDHYLWFANLPQQCTIRLFTLSGDLIYETAFDGQTYNGSNADGITPLGADLKTILPGTMWGWDMITRQGQAVATGLYIWSVEDKHSGKKQAGKILIVKSDRESF